MRLLALFCEAAGIAPSARREVALGDLRLPTWHFRAEPAHGTLVVFGGFDSYIEELFPILASFQANLGRAGCLGWREKRP